MAMKLNAAQQKRAEKIQARLRDGLVLTFGLDPRKPADDDRFDVSVAGWFGSVDESLDAAEAMLDEAAEHEKV